MDYIQIVFFIVIILVSLLIGYQLWNLIRAIISYFKAKKIEAEALTEHTKLANENKMKAIELTNQMLDLVRMTVGQVTTLKFRSFRDSHDMTKVTQSNIKSLVEDIARTVKNSFDKEVFSFNDTFFTDEFLNIYIIETTVIFVKDLTEKVIDDLDI